MEARASLPRRYKYPAQALCAAELSVSSCRRPRDFEVISESSLDN